MTTWRKGRVKLPMEPLEGVHMEDLTELNPLARFSSRQGLDKLYKELGFMDRRPTSWSIEARRCRCFLRPSEG